MLDPAELNLQDFEPWVGKTFVVETPERLTVEMTLIEAKARGSFDPTLDSRQAFSLLFCAERGTALVQATVELRNAEFGQLAVFMVPCGPDSRGELFDVTFG